MRNAIVALMVVMVGCQAPERERETEQLTLLSQDVTTLDLDAEVLASYESNTPCGFDLSSLHDFPTATYRHEAVCDSTESQDIQVKLHIDGTGALDWVTESGSFSETITWVRLDGSCVVRLDDSAGNTIVYLGNAVPDDDGSGFFGFDFLAPQREGLGEGHASCVDARITTF